MREWALTNAIVIDEFPPLPNWRRWLRNWLARRDVVRLRDLDDRMLADIGLTREDIDMAAHLPLRTNATLALDELARERDRRRRRNG